MAALADLVGLVGLEAVLGPAVLVGKTATVRAPISYAARNARIAISPRLATSTLENMGGTLSSVPGHASLPVRRTVTAPVG